MRADAAAVESKLTALEPSTGRLPAEPDPAREANLKQFELGYRRLWPHIVTDDPDEYVRSKVERYAMYRLGETTDAGHVAKDVAQNAFVCLHEMWFVDVPPATFPATDGAFDSAVFKAIRAAVSRQRRDDGKLKRHIMVALGMKPNKTGRFHARPEKVKRWMFGYPDAHPFFDAVIEASEKLPPKMRAVFQMKWRDGYKYKEIAARLRISKKTVSAHLQKANERLQLMLRDYQPERDGNWLQALNRLANIDNPNYTGGAAPEDKRDASHWSPYSIVDLEGIVPADAPLSTAALIEMYSPMLPDPLRFLSFIVGAVRYWPDIFFVHSRAEELEAKGARVLTPYLAREADPRAIADVDQTLRASPDIVELMGPLLATWKLAPGAMRGADVDSAWSDFQRRVGLPGRGFNVTHVRHRMWWARWCAVVMLALGFLGLWQAGTDFVAQGRSVDASVTADAGFAALFFGLSMIQSAQVQVVRRSRALVLGAGGAVIVLVMDLFRAWAGW